jgi:hypothetical protein
MALKGPICLKETDMLVSNRFTKTITEGTRTRLSQVLDNSKPMTRREKNSGAVVAVQAALSDLNQGYLVSAEVDGFFGNKTAQAVESFQRDYGLFADGIVGRQTLTELDQIFSSELFREPQGMSIHVGVNFVDEAHYGDPYPLSACVNDANDFRTLARGLGYNDVILTNEQATTSNFIAAVRQAATNLFSGDYLFVTFSGHGSQLTNTSLDNEVDGMDETLCFYDRMMIDDEVYGLLTEIRPGVNVTILYDSCHSATVTKFMPGGGVERALAIVAEERVKDFKEKNVRSMMRRVNVYDPEVPDTRGEEEAGEDRFVPYQTKQLMKALDGDKAKQVTRAPIAIEKVIEIVDAVVEIGAEVERAPARFIPIWKATGPGGIYERNQSLYEAVKSLVGDREQTPLDCHVITFSACQDNQTTLDGTVNGLYSGNVLGTWDNAGFNGSIRQMHNRLVSDSPSTITPALHTYGGPRAEARLHERPFAF